MKLRLHISPCPNDTFMFDALINGRIDTQGLEFEAGFEDIENLNDRALNEGTDICKISCAVLPEITSRYALLHSGGALGRGNGPLLVGREGADFSKLPGPAAGIPGPLKVAIPGRHTTANLLMSRLYPHITDKPSYLFSDIAPAVLRGECVAGVLIHEGRFTYREKGLTLIADLGAEWERRTGLPLALGGIVVSRKLPAATGLLVESLVRQSIEYALAHPEASAAFVRRHARELSDEVTRRHIEMFVNDFSIALGAEGERAVRELTGLMAEKIFIR